MYRPIMIAVGVLIGSMSCAARAEPLKVSISQRGFWDSSFVDFALKEGFFKEVGLEVEPFYTEGGAQTLTTVTSESVDIGLSNGLLGVVGAYAKGAPIRVISAQMTGANELYWYVKSDSSIRSLVDAEGKTIAFSSPGSSSNLVLLALLKQAQSKAKPVATGGFPSTHTQVMTGQIDIGWGVPPFGLQDLADGRIRIVARARDVAELKDQTIRVNLVHADVLKSKRDAIARFMRIYARTIDWAYENPRAIQYFADSANVSVPIARKAVEEFFPKSALQLGEIRGIDRTLADALTYKFLPAAKIPRDVEGLFDIVYRPPAQ
jgi:NitT/TauT family transport system substrate-binding protein